MFSKDIVMGKLFDQTQSEPICAKDIVISGHGPMIFISEHDDVFCYTGILLNEREAHLETLPHYFEGKHSTDKSVKSKTRGFFRISQGCILLDCFIDEGVYRKEEKYKISECFIRLPVGASTSYGVFKSIDEEDIGLTRAIFGLPYDELCALLKVYANIFGIYNDYVQYPRITRYQRHDNYCDFCGLWIPEQYPYITFAESGYSFSHVSLWGCYRHLQLIMSNNANSRIAKLFIDDGVDKTILDYLMGLTEFELRKNSYYAQIVNKDMLHHYYEEQQN